MGIIDNIVSVILDTLLDLAPLVGLILFFQIVVIRKKLANWRRVAIGFVYVVVGLSLFLIGLQTALFPLGETMARQLTDPEFLGLTRGVAGAWYDYFWVYIFAAAIGLGTTIAEPALIAVADKAGSVSGGTINPWGLRIAVAIGVSVGATLGTFRIVTGIPLFWSSWPATPSSSCRPCSPRAPSFRSPMIRAASPPPPSPYRWLPHSALALPPTCRGAAP